MGIMNTIFEMQKIRDEAVSLGHDAKNWNVLGKDTYTLVCKDCMLTTIYNEHSTPMQSGDSLNNKCVKPEKKLKKK